MTHTFKAVAAAFAATLVLGGQPMSAQSGQDLFQKALAAERADGNVRRAIQLYEDIVKQFEKTDRALVAKTLVQLGQAYEKLGSAEAKKRYELVTKQFADQAEAARVAQDRLVALGSTATSSLTVRQLLTTSDDLSGAFLTADGRFLAFPDDQSDGPAIRDIQTGRVSRLTTRSAKDSLAITTILSPDRKLIVYSWRDDRHYELRVIANDPAARPRSIVISDSLESYLVPKAWWPDGKSILVERRNPDDTWQFLRVPAAGGPPRLLVSLDWRRPLSIGFRRVDLSADGKYLVYSALTRNPVRPNPPPGERSDERIYLLATDGSQQTELTRVAGNNLNPMWTPSGSHVLFLSDRTGIFDLWAIAVTGGKPAGTPFVVKHNIGRIVPLGMSSDGTYRYHSGAKNESQISFATFGQAAALKPFQSNEPLLGTAPRWSPDGSSIAVLRQAASGTNAVDLVVRSMATGEEQRFALPSTAARYAADIVRPIWTPDGGGVLVAVPQAGGTQTIYRADLKTGESREAGALGRFVTGGQGLRATISPNGKTLYARGTVTTSWDDVHLNRITAVELRTGEQRQVMRLPSPYIVGDLALSPDGRTLSFVALNWDEQKAQVLGYVLARVDVDGSGYRELTHDLEPALGSMNMKWSVDGGTILLSRVDQSGEIRLMRIGSEGGPPELIGVVAKGRITLDVEPERSRVAVATPTRSYEIWTLEHLPAALTRTR